MALLFMDGFDQYGSTGNITGFGKWVIGLSGNTLGTSTVPRTGTYAASAPWSVFQAATKVLPASGGFVVGVALRITTAPTGVDWLIVQEGTTGHMALSITAAGVFQVKCGSTVLGTGTMVLAINNWYYIEFKGIIHDTTGSYELRIDGATELVSTGPVVTRNGGTTGQWNRVNLTSPSNVNSASYFDDFYACDMSGTLRNNFLGAIKIETLVAQPGNGSNFGLTPSTGTDHGALVDENPPNTTDYNSGVVVGLKDTYNLPSVTQSGPIVAIQVNLYASKVDAGARQLCAVIRTGGADFDGANISPLTTFQFLSTIWAQNPATLSDWTTVDINALEVGMKVTV